MGVYRHNSISASHGNWLFGHDLPKKIVLKCDHGARGIGQLLVDTTKTSLGAVSNIVTKASVGNSAEFKAKLDELSVIYNTDGEHHEGEGLSSLKGQGYHGCEYIDDVTSEYRMLVNGDDIYVCSRVIKGNSEFSQATGAKDTFDSESNLISIADGLKGVVPAKELKVVIKEIRTMLTKTKFHYGSVDLFLTSKGEWGFFEVSNQFGTSAFTPEAMFNFHVAFIKRILKEHKLIK